MKDLIESLKILKGFTLYEKYVFIMIIALWMDIYLSLIHI